MDLVRLEAQERLDLPDTQALQALMGAFLGRTMGALMGNGAQVSGKLFGGGCLVEPGYWDTSDVTQVEIGPGLFFSVETTTPDLSGRVGQVIRHDPNGPVGPVTVNLGAFVAGAQKPWIWIRPVWVDASLDLRRKWDTGTATEVAVGINTQSVQCIEATATLAYPAGSEWIPIARVVSWAGVVPTLRERWAWDIFDVAADPDVAITEAGFAGQGLVTLLAEVRNILALHYDSAGTDKWYSAPTVGLKQLAAEDADLNRRAVKVHGNYDVAVGAVTRTAATQYENAPAAGTYVAAGNFALTFPTPILRSASLERADVRLFWAAGANVARHVQTVFLGSPTHYTGIQVLVWNAGVTLNENPSGGFEVTVW